MSTYTNTDTLNTDLLAEYAKGLRRLVRQHDRWFALCDALSAARRAGDAAAEAEATAAYLKGRCPSKNAKHRAYDLAAQIERMLSIPREALPSAGTRAEWAEALAAAEATL